MTHSEQKPSSKYNKLFYVLFVVVSILYVFLLIALTRIEFTISPDISNLITYLLIFTLVGLVFAFGIRYVSIQRSTSHELSDDMKALSDRLQTTEKKLMETEVMLTTQTHTFIVYNTLKEITLLNSDGDAVIEYSFRCKNNPDKELNSIGLHIIHDGNLQEGTVECSVNDEKVKPNNVQRFVSINEDTKEPAKVMPHSLRFQIVPFKPIQPSADFSYNYKYKIRKLYPKMTTKSAEFTQTNIVHPTHHLKCAIKAPPTYFFDISDVRIEVIDRDDIRYAAEEKRMTSESPPEVLDKDKILYWDISFPRLANLYRIWFSVRKDHENHQNNVP